MSAELTAMGLHVASGLLAVPAGYAALAARKGGGLHRSAGNVFFASMLVMAVFAAVLGLPLGGALVCYLVISSWLTVHDGAGAADRRHAVVFGSAAALTVVALAAGVLRAGGSTPAGEGDGAGPLAVAALAGLCAALDFRALRQGGLAGFERVRRHLWRMCAAMFIATGSFFLGQADEVPRALHGPHLWALALAPLAALIWWMFRTRPRKRTAQAAPA